MKGVAKQRDTSAGKRRRERAAVIAMTLFPMLIGVGFFAPGWVRVFATAQELNEGPRGPLVDRIGPFSRRPLPAPQEFHGASAPELLDADKLFAGDSSPIAPGVAERVGAFPRSHGDSIVLDDVGDAPPTIAFKDILTDPPPNPLSQHEDEGVLPMCATAPFGNCVRYDDFTGVREFEDQTPVPEPGTGALLALGLGWLARRRSRA